MSDEDAARHVARERGAEVLRDLQKRAGISVPEIAQRSILEGRPITDQTGYNMLAAKPVRSVSVDGFIAGCLYQQQRNPRLAGTQGTPEYWKARFDEALGGPAEPTAGLVRIGKPPPRADEFVVRPDVALVAQAVEAGQSVVLTAPSSDVPLLPPRRERVRVLSGLGGVGKTQLAAQYVREVWSDPGLELIIWVSARSTSQVVAQYANAAVRLLGIDPGDPEQGAARLMEWLALTSRPWLIVLDDVQLPTDVDQWWPESTEVGQVIVTTRYRGEGLWRSGRQVIEVGVYSQEQALDYLKRRLTKSHPDASIDLETAPDTQLAALARDLGYLPLALAHASAFLIHEQMTVAQYQALFAENRTRLADLFPPSEERPDPYPDTVATTWLISLELACRLKPGGMIMPVLVFSSLLDPAGMPYAVLTQDAAQTYLQTLLGREIEVREVESSVQLLHRLNLLTHDRDDQWREIKVHALVQRATRDAATVEASAFAVDVDSVARAAADALLQVWPSIESNVVQAQALRANTQALRMVAGDLLWRSGIHAVLIRAGQSLGEAGQLAGAVHYFDQLRIAAMKVLSPYDLDILLVRGQAARWRGEGGHPDDARAMMKQLVTDMTRVLGSDHPKTLAALADTAHWRGEVGDLAGAIQEMRCVLPRLVVALGDDDSETLSVRHNMACLHGRVGDPARAVRELDEILADRSRVLGPDDPETLATRHNLAFYWGQAGDSARAAAEFERLRHDYIRVLGPEHPTTLLSYANVVYWRGQAGDAAGAAAAAEQLLAEYLRVLGPDHPHTLNTRHGLANWRGESGDPTGAVAILEDLRDDCLRVMSPDHTETLNVRRSLAHWWGKAGHPADAKAALEDVLTDYLRVLTSDHPATLLARRRLAHWRGEAGDVMAAITDLKDLLTDCRRVLGSEHPQAQAVERDLQHWVKRAAV